MNDCISVIIVEDDQALRANLTDYLNSSPLRTLLKDNPQIIQAYEEVREVAELNLPDETK